MANLSQTMERARRSFPSDAAPVKRAPPPAPAAPPDSPSEADGIDSDVALRLKSLDLEQLAQVAEALGRRVDDADEVALRRSIAAWTEEWVTDFAEDHGEEDQEAARAAGRQEAISGLEEEVFRALLDHDIPPAEWRDAMGVSEERLEELTAQAVADGWLEEPDDPPEPTMQD